jgi:hypothetical protein
LLPLLLKRQDEPYPSYGEVELLKRLATSPSWIQFHLAPDSLRSHKNNVRQ